MSHFTTIAVQIADGDLLEATLRDMGHPVERQACVRGYAGNKIAADYVVRLSNGYDIGFRRQGQTFELIADLWGLEVDPQQFLMAVMQKYAHKSLLATASAEGYAIEREEVLSDGSVRVTIGRWV